MANKKKERALTPKELLALLQDSTERETLLHHENALLRDRLLLHEEDAVVRRLVHEPGEGSSRGRLVLTDDARVIYQLP